jgi:tetratricopeptide (TPR) repeat protein
VTGTVVLTALLILAPGSEAPDPDALAREVLALSASGDPSRLARASAAVPEPLRADPAFRGAAAGRALARFLAAADLRETSAASPDGADGLRRARGDRETALEELRPLVLQAPEDPDVLRSLSVYYGLDGRPEEVARLAARAPATAAADPWFGFAALAAAVRGRTPSEAEPLLSAFVAAHPEIHPPRMSLARARLARGDPEGAVGALDDLLALDPDHQAAKDLKAALLAPPPLERLAPVVPPSAPPPSAPGFLPRKRAKGAVRRGPGAEHYRG